MPVTNRLLLYLRRLKSSFMKKGMLVLIIFCLYGCVPYSIIGYKNHDLDIKEYDFSVGYFYNHTARLNKLPKVGLVFYAKNKYKDEKKIDVLSVESKTYGSLESTNNDIVKESDLFFKDMSWEKQKLTREKILTDTIKVIYKDSNAVSRVIRFYN